jgi:hypothetical protein
MSAPNDVSTVVPATASQPSALKTQADNGRMCPQLAAVKKISHRQEVAVANLIKFPTMTQAARASKVSERTLRRWLQRPQFAARFQAAKQAILQRTVDSLLCGSERAARQLVKLATDPKVSDGARVRACVKTLELVVKQVQIREIERRLAEIEVALKRMPAKRAW